MDHAYQDQEAENGPDLRIDGHGYFTRRRLSRALGKSPQTLASWAVRGYGPPFVKIGKTPAYPEDGVKRFLKQPLTAEDGGRNA